MTAADLALRRGAGLFRLADRGLLEVTGADRTRWLDGMISNEVASIAPGGGRYALLLDPKGRILADLHVLVRPEAFWLELAAHAAEPTRERLERFVIADDVEIANRSGEWARLALEGPAAPAVVDRAAGAPLGLAPDGSSDAAIGDVSVVAAAFALAGGPGIQLFVPVGGEDAVASALARAGAPLSLVVADAAALEVLRIEAGVPRLGAELDADVFPAEARLERAISFTKGCYTGQEIVARIRTRASVQHFLVGLSLEGAAEVGAGAEIAAEGRPIGEVTSACRSPVAGSIALGYVRRSHAEPDTRVTVGGHPARVTALPFVEARGRR